MEIAIESENLLVNALYYLTAAVIAVPLFKKLGLGSILGYLCAGMFLGPHILGVNQEPEAVLHFAEYGVILLLFIIGLELAPEKLWDMRVNISVIGGSQIVLTSLVFGLVFWLFDLTPAQACILGLTLALSSTAFAIQLMSEEHILASPLGRQGLAILLLQDIAVIPILILVEIMGQSGGESTAMPWYFGVAAV